MAYWHFCINVYWTYHGKEKTIDTRKGLGKDETGISKPIKCGLKFDKMGIGFQEKLTKETTNRWWEQAYNKAASNITSTGASKEGSSIDTSAFANLTDEELFKACGGRTAHKAARHGLRLSGKLERIEHQEKKSFDKRKKKENNVESESCKDGKNDGSLTDHRENKSLDKRKRKKSTRRQSDSDNEKNDFAFQNDDKLINVSKKSKLKPT